MFKILNIRSPQICSVLLFFFLLEKRGGERFKRKCDLKKKFFRSAAMKFFVAYKGFYAAFKYVISFLVSCTVLIVYHDNV